MQKLIVFNHVSLDGYFTSAKGDMSWAHKGNDDPEYAAFVAENASGNAQLLFGRVTYEMMANYWPTPAAMQQMPAVAEGMNRMKKIVFSRTLDKTTWANTTLIKGDLAGSVRKLKTESGDGIAILGSGNIVSQLAQEGLIDEYQFMVNPIALGKGRTMLDGIRANLSLKFVKSRIFRNGKALLCYQAA